MISKKDLKVYEYNHINEYFDYVITSEINGQRKQARELISDLSKQQKKDFFYYLEFLNMEDRDIKEVHNLLVELS